MSWLQLCSDITAGIFQRQSPPYSSQTWLRIRITWGTLTNYCGLAATPAILTQVGWGATWKAGILNAPQEILNCSYIWEGLSPSFCFCDTLHVSQSHLRPAVFLLCGLKRHHTQGLSFYNLGKNKENVKARLSGHKVKDSRKKRKREREPGERGKERQKPPPRLQRNRILSFCCALIPLHGCSTDEPAP